MAELTDRACVPCEGGTPPLNSEAISAFHAQTPEWQTVRNHHLMRAFRFKNFAEALSFVNEVGELAEREKHHPDIHLSWGKVVVEIFTHKIDGLTENDFILAAKVDLLHQLH